jgi:hypothetical protein
MPKFRKKPVVIEAVRYGKDEDGRWYPGSVQRVAAFMLGREIDAEVPERQIVDVLRPVGVWDPPEFGDLEMWVEKSQAWCTITPGTWVLAEADGVGFYPCTAEQFAASYEPVTA